MSNDIRDMIQGVLANNQRERDAACLARVQAEKEQALARANWERGRAQRLANGKKWLCQHFNTTQKEDGLLDPPIFTVRFWEDCGVTLAEAKLRSYGNEIGLFGRGTFMWLDKYGQGPRWCNVMQIDGVWFPMGVELVVE